MAFAVAEKRISQPPLIRHFSLEEYLVRESRSQSKHEFFNGTIKVMPSAKYKHNLIASNVGAALKMAVRPLPKKFRVLNSDQKIYIQSVGAAVYPVALVICEEPEFWDGREDLLVNPLVIVEVHSRSTRSFDWGKKFLLYEELPSFRAYVLIEQTRISVESWFRERPDAWVKTVETDVEKGLFLKALGVEIALADIYDGTEF